MANERKELGHRLAIRTQEEVFALTRKVLTDLAGVEVEERMVDVFIEHLHSLPPEQRRSLTASPTIGLGGASPPALVRSAFELALPARTRIKTAVTECLGPDIATRFETSPGLVCGVELTFDGVKLAWSVTDYLSSASEAVLSLVGPAVITAAPELAARHA